MHTQSHVIKTGWDKSAGSISSSASVHWSIRIRQLSIGLYIYIHIVCAQSDWKRHRLQHQSEWETVSFQKNFQATVVSTFAWCSAVKIDVSFWYLQALITKYSYATCVMWRIPARLQHTGTVPHEAWQRSSKRFCGIFHHFCIMNLPKMDQVAKSAADKPSRSAWCQALSYSILLPFTTALFFTPLLGPYQALSPDVCLLLFLAILYFDWNWLTHRKMSIGGMYQPHARQEPLTRDAYFTFIGLVVTLFGFAIYQLCAYWDDSEMLIGMKWNGMLRRFALTLTGTVSKWENRDVCELLKADSLYISHTQIYMCIYICMLSALKWTYLFPIFAKHTWTYMSDLSVGLHDDFLAIRNWHRLFCHCSSAVSFYEPHCWSIHEHSLSPAKTASTL